MEAKTNLYQKNKKLFTRFEGLFFSNTVLERGLVVATVVVMGNTLKNAVALTLVFSILTFLTVCITYFVPRKIPYTFRVIIHSIISAIIFIPTSLFVNFLIRDIIFSLGIFMPLLVINSLIIGVSSARFHKKKFIPMLVDLFSHFLGFAVVICLVAILREIFGLGTVWGISVPFITGSTAFLLPFSGFIIVGIFAAILQKIKINFIKEKEME